MIYARNSNLLEAKLGSDVLTLCIERGVCHGMEGVAATIWDLLSEPSDLNSLCRKLGELYDVDPGVCRREVESFLNEMRAEKLIVGKLETNSENAD